MIQSTFLCCDERDLTDTYDPRCRSRPTHTDATARDAFTPQKGDVILCNWSSWIDVLYLVTRFNPTFVRPVVSAPPTSGAATSSESRSSATRRRDAATRGQQHAGIATNTSAAQAQTSSVTGEQRILGWKQASFLDMMMRSGSIPETSEGKANMKPLDSLLKEADGAGPVVLFPEVSVGLVE